MKKYHMGVMGKGDKLYFSTLLSKEDIETLGLSRVIKKNETIFVASLPLAISRVQSYMEGVEPCPIDIDTLLTIDDTSACAFWTYRWDPEKVKYSSLQKQLDKQHRQMRIKRRNRHRPGRMY